MKKTNAFQKTTGALSSFFGEFKTFITRGNVVDMAVGMIVGASFSAIVNALSNSILKPLVNGLLWVLTGGTDGFAGLISFINRVNDEAGFPDYANSIYINWGDLFTSILNFLITAFALFAIIKTLNRLKAVTENVTDVVAIAKAKQAKGMKLLRYEKRALAEALAAEEAAAAKEAEKAEAAAKAEEEEEKLRAAEEARNGCESRQEAILCEIRDLLKKN